MTELLYLPSAFSSMNMSESLTLGGTDHKTEKTSAPHLKRKKSNSDFSIKTSSCHLEKKVSVINGISNSLPYRSTAVRGT